MPLLVGTPDNSSLSTLFRNIADSAFKPRAAQPDDDTPAMAPAPQPTPVVNGSTPPAAPTGEVQQKIAAAADKYGVPQSEALQIGKIESHYNQGAVSPAGAIGVMQLMPQTAAGLGVDPSNVDQNIDGGVRYYAQMRQRYGDPVKAAAAYNAGPGRIDKVLAGQGTLPAETQGYIAKFAPNNQGQF